MREENLCLGCLTLISHTLFCVGFLAIVFSGIKLASSVDSVYAPTECLITGGSINRSTNSYSSCYYPLWQVNGSEREGSLEGDCLTFEKDAEKELASYALGTEYPCFIQVGRNTFAPLFVWPGSDLLNVTTERIVLCSVIIAVSGICILIHLVLLPLTCLSTRENEQPEEALVTLSNKQKVYLLTKQL